MLFQDLGARKVVADFSGGYLSTDAGGLLLKSIDRGLGVIAKLATCFRDGRDARYVEHGVEELLAQRIYGQALGYEDLNDHNDLRRDPLLAVAVGKEDPLGEKRSWRDQGHALAGSSTLNRLELSNVKESRYHKLDHDPGKIEATLLEMGVRSLPKHAREVVLDFDASDDPLHGRQEGRFFHGYYGEYCYLPLFCFAGDVILWAQLRTSDRDASDGTVEALEKIVAAIRTRLPKMRIIVRGDSGFCREGIMEWCEAHGIYYCLGLARNCYLQHKLEKMMARVRERQCLCGGSVREFVEFMHEPRSGTWSRERRVIGKAEVSSLGDNPRFIVTNLPAEGFAEKGEQAGRFLPEALYEKFYCGRGSMENMVKQMQLDLHADRTSTHSLVSNQLRLWFAAFAYLLLERTRALTLQGSDLARASLGTIRLKLLKVAALVTVSVRRIHVRLASAYPLQALWRGCHQRAMALSAAAG
ncbi:MAG: IS1380 family transposase [Verrucomicrobiaceae bacterium]|nr:MAG: IS1380 family transposase [Verrucomicrobiaceae bacterium]